MKKFLSVKLLLTFFVLFSVSWAKPIQAKTIVYAEYFIDTDPGQGFGTPLSACDGTLDEASECLYLDSISSDTLTEGSHTLFVRIKDSDNVWGTIRKLTFRVIGSSPYKTMDTAEYFIDTDPGVGLGIPLTADDGAFDESAEDAHKNNIDTDSLSLGGHQVYVRFKDNWSYWPTFNGWGPTKVDTLCVCQRCSLLTPLNGSKGPCNRTFKWTHRDSVASYQLQIDTSHTFNNPIRNLTVAVETCYVTGLPDHVPLWWRVRGNYNCGAGVWSDSFLYNTPVEEEIEEEQVSPKSFFLSRNFPNPFNPETQIDYDLPRGCNVNLTIYNLLGQKVTTLVDEFQSKGFKTVHWDGKNNHGQECASGIYFYRLEAGDFSQSNKMILLR
jgi:hypothetical protein